MGPRDRPHTNGLASGRARYHRAAVGKTVPSRSARDPRVDCGAGGAGGFSSTTQGVTPMKEEDVHVTRNRRDRRSGRISRRRALRILGSGLAGTVAAPWVIRHALADQLVGPGGIALARPNQPVTLPRFEDPIKSGLEPEKGGTFTIFNYSDYIDKKLVEEFGKKYNVKTQITTFDSMDQAINKLSKKAVRADVTEITPERISQAV